MTEQQQSVINCTFATKVSTGNYENEEYRLSISQVVDPTLSGDELILEAEELGRKVKSQVYTEAGIDFSVEDDGRIMQVLSKSVPGPKSGKASPKAPSAGASPAAAKKSPPRKSPPRKGGKVNAEAAALWTHLAEIEDPKAEFFDNRDRIASGDWKPNAPYFKHKKTDTKLFLSDCPEDIKEYFVDGEGDVHFESIDLFA